MILSYFIPEKIGAYFFLARRTASVVITKSAVRIALVRAARTQRFIEKLIEEPIQANGALSEEERTVQALNRALEQVPTNNTLVAIFPSTYTIPKIVAVPSIGEEKIKMIIPFEIEASLPFPLSEALIDCVITDRDAITQQAHVLVVATRTNFLEQYLALYRQTPRIPDAITTHIVALFTLFSDILSNNTQGHTNLIMCIEDDAAHMLLMKNKQLLAVRTIPFIHNKAAEEFVEEIAATTRYFANILPEDERTQIHHILCGSEAENRSLHAALNTALHTECELITSSKILHSGTIHTTLSLTAPFLIPIAAALPAATADSFNLDKERAEAKQRKSLLYQSLVVAGLTLLLFGTVITTRLFMVHRLRKELNASEREAVELLKTRINLKDVSKNATLDSVNAKARRAVAHEEEIWFSLSGKNRSTALLALQELSKHINREALGLNLEEISISESTGTMTLKGEVKDFPELSILTDSLRKSEFFKDVPNLQEKKFTAKINLDINAGEL